MKLDQIGKKNVFKAPEHYFDGLPGRIQERVQEKTESGPIFNINLAWKVALPAMVLLIAIYLIPFQSANDYQFEESALIEYLSENDVTISQIIEVYEIDNEVLAVLFEDEMDISEEAIESQLEWEEIELLLINE